MWRTACPYVGYSESVNLLYLSKGKRKFILGISVVCLWNWQTAVLLLMLPSQWATTYSLGKWHTDVISLPLVIWCSWIRRDTSLISDLAHLSPSGAQWGSRSTLILERASILAYIGKREASSPALDWCCPLQTFKERGWKVWVTKLLTLWSQVHPSVCPWCMFNRLKVQLDNIVHPSHTAGQDLWKIGTFHKLWFIVSKYQQSMRWKLNMDKYILEATT